jgi:5'-nucleotidase
MHILLCNDDGLQADGLQLLRSELRKACPDFRITTVAPDREQSAASHALTLTDPLRVEEHGEDQFAVSGTPTDCVLIALHGLLRECRPDVVISGINHGPNMGEDVHYSGTVAGAFEGRVLGLPGIAISLASRQRPFDFSGARQFVAEVLPSWLNEGFDRGTLLNVNIPSLPTEEIAGIRFCPLGSREYHDVVVRKEDPRGRAYYWIGGGDSLTISRDENTDFVLSAQGFVTVTPLHVDITDYKRLVELKGLQRSWPR